MIARGAVTVRVSWPHSVFMMALLVGLSMRTAAALAVAPVTPLSLVQEGRELLTPRRAGSILVQNIASSDVLFNHLAKCGGTFVQKVIRASVNASIIQKEHMGLDTQALKGDPFVIGLVRNPYEYYISLWAYTSMPKSCCFVHSLTRQQQVLTLGRRTPYGKHKDDRERFREWLRIVSDKELGLMSLRFWGSYLQMDEHVFPNFQHSLATEENVTSASSDINDALRKFSRAARSGGKASAVDCYVRTEDLDGGLTWCMKRYEREAGGTVDWAAFRKHLDANHHNPSTHAPCDELYDDEAFRFVESGDGHVISAFNYTRCGDQGLPRHSNLH